MAMKRKRLPMKQSKKLFHKTAKRSHRKNMRPMVMRGGFRI